MDRVSMEAYFVDMRLPAFHARQILKWIYQYGVTDFKAMTNLSKTLRNNLSDIAEFKLPEIVTERTSKDGTRKWLLRVDSKNSIETVLIPEKTRNTLCISSQVGCALDCSFCSTGKQGFSRNLSVAEIIGQLWLVCKALDGYPKNNSVVSNIVMMGMGEPMLNFDNVIKAINLMTDDHAFGLASRKVTLSTSGLVPAINKLAELTKISLAISLHATNNELRNELVPVNRSYPLEELIDACKRYVKIQTSNKITFEYVMLDGINDSETEARMLVKLLQGIPAKVNLIPFNSFPGSHYQCSDPVVISKFRDILMKSGLVTIIRKTRGDDIDAACGQLVGKLVPRARRHQNCQLMEGVL